MLLSILIPSITERAAQASKLLEALHLQALGRDVEIITLVDNRKIPLSVKRNTLLGLATGKFIVHIDDDDDVSVDFMHEVMLAIESHPEVDVICYDQIADLSDGRVFRVTTDLGYSNEQHVPTDGTFPVLHRKPWHWCAWRADLAKKHSFVQAPDDDWQWLQQLLVEAKTQFKIDKVLHYYNWSSEITTFK